MEWRLFKIECNIVILFIDIISGMEYLKYLFIFSGRWRAGACLIEVLLCLNVGNNVQLKSSSIFQLFN